MKMVEVDVPEELLELLKGSRLGGRSVPEQVRLALAIHLMQEGVISAGKAASMSGEPRASFELLLAEIGIPAGRHDVAEYRQDRDAFERARSE